MGTHSVEPQLHTVSESGATPHTTAAAPSQQGQPNPPPSPQAHRSGSQVTSVVPPSSELPLPTPTIPPPKKKKKKRKNAKEVPPETPPQEFTHSVEPQLHTVSESGATPHTTAAAPSQQGQTNPPPSPQAHRSGSQVTSVVPPSSELPLPTPAIPPSKKKKKKKKKKAKEVPPETPPQDLTHSVEPQLHTVSESGATPHTTAAAPSQQGQTNPPPSPQAHRSGSQVTSVVPPSSELPLPTPAIPP